MDPSSGLSLLDLAGNRCGSASTQAWGCGALGSSEARMPFGIVAPASVASSGITEEWGLRGMLFLKAATCGVVLADTSF